MVEEYIKTLQRQVTSRSVWTYTLSLYDGLSHMAPDEDWSWLNKAVNRLQRRAKPAKAIAPRLVATQDIVAAGLQEMRAAQRRKPIRSLSRSV